ncbi:MAG TPA: TIGR03086 family metal-binding protein [Pseudonocardia sp.]|uniref:TIGR03086 family metal-binding protein n=1 Tax=Pseudonocardia sp. TaxID=60912 RepID=UPI002B4B7919|nr:TIGR03086 family metal-binding protein [Pseudonocardia sp.]HLU60594.1 TIGR03086 family metal-binding protein [Pseudonocardia sp.]
MENIRELHRRAVDGIRPVLARITPADLDRPTPCAGWALRALLEHMAGQDHGFAATVRATRTGEEVDVAAFAPRPVGADPAPALTAGLDDLVAAFAQVGDEDGPVLLPEFGTRAPVPVVVHMHLIDTLVHGWDVAAALGAQDDYGAGLDAEVVAAALAMTERIPDDESREAPGAPFGHALPAAPDADPWTRVLTSLGRDPAWAGEPVPRG